LGWAFCVDDDTIAYGNAQGIVNEVPRSGATVKWMRGGWALGSRFELQTPDGLYRFYLNRPHPSAPTPEPSLLNNVASFLSGGGQLLSLVDGTLGTFGSVAGPVGDLAGSITILSGARAGIRNAEARWASRRKIPCSLSADQFGFLHRDCRRFFDLVCGACTTHLLGATRSLADRSGTQRHQRERSRVDELRESTSLEFGI